MSFAKFDLSKGALLFDCDGTITDENFLPTIVGKTIQKIVEDAGQTYNSDIFDEVFSTNKGGGFDKYYMGYLNATNNLQILDDVSIDEFSERSIDYYLTTAKNIAAGTEKEISFKFNQDAVDLIKWANENNVPVSIVTNANEKIVRANLQAAGIGIAGETDGEVYTQLVVDRSMYGKGAPLRKPNPFPFEEACYLLGVDPANCIGFEDSANGHLSLFRANIGLRVHVCEHEPTEPVFFVREGEHFGPDAVAPYGKLTADFISNLIEKRNGMGNIISIEDFAPAAQNTNVPSNDQAPIRRPAYASTNSPH